MSLIRVSRTPGIFTRIAIAILLLLGSAAHASADGFVTPSTLLEVFGTQDIDNIRSVLNSVKAMHYKGEVLPILHDVWKERKDKYSKLDWSTLKKPIIRAELADILSQAWRNGKIRLDETELHAATVAWVESDDVEVAEIALQTLAVFDSADDVEKIASIARKQEMGTFQMAISTLTIMCNASAEKAVIKLMSETTDKTNVQFIKKTKGQTDSFKKETSMCSLRMKPTQAK